MSLSVAAAAHVDAEAGG